VVDLEWDFAQALVVDGFAEVAQNLVVVPKTVTD
jgi:hypothetical protein